ncbi:uncharacterized protein LOC141590252 [Silene latifolia]|uniref:uncharacterized protein LOC141590252 n=1 Tax=Silene latifolia TaxID=37657 RepID=UPI003D77C579
MLAAAIPSELRQVCMYKGFGTTLTGPTLQWYINLPNGSIKSFADLINSFNNQFASSRELEKRSSDLYRIMQKPSETIRAFLTRFNKKNVSIPRCDVGTVVDAFRQGLPLDSDFYDELTMKPCLTFEDVQAKAIGYIRLEEDKSFKAETSDSVSGYERSNRKSSNHKGSSSRPSPYTRPDRSEVNYSHEQRGNSYTYPPIQEYNFSVDTAGLIKRLDNMGDIVKWPKKTDNPNSRKDTTRWCKFHMDIGHTTEECLGLRKQVAYLLKKGYLKDLMPSKNREDSGSRKDQERPQRDLPPTPLIYEVKFINGGSEICGILDIHHDDLVITMQIGTARLLRILVDGGRSVNVLKAMRIDENQIIRKSNVLVGFSGETKSTLREIYLPTYVEGVSSYERFGVLYCLSS